LRRFSAVAQRLREDLLRDARLMSRFNTTAAVTDAVQRLTGQPPRSLRRHAEDHREALAG
jgi:hypothetical protein